MTNEELQKANQGIKTTAIKGKDYADVNQRIKAFRSVCPNGRIENELLSLDNGMCIFKSTVFDEGGHVLGVGHAYEKEDSSYINKTSFIENCETSAVGRALGMCGFGIDTSVASFEEVANAVKQQENNRSSKTKQDTDFPKLNARFCAAIAEKKGVTSAEVYNQAIERAGSDAPEKICKALCSWIREIINDG